MRTLVFDTCLNKTYVTLAQNGEILTSVTIENKEEKYHSAFLISSIVKILKDFNLRIQDMDAFGVNIGPGSFTGIRACVTVARVFAQQTQKPLVGVSSLEIISRINNSDKNTIVLMDARRKQHYFAMYSKQGFELIEPGLISADELSGLDFENADVICDTFTKSLLDEKNIECTDFSLVNIDLGVILSKLVAEKLKSDSDYFWANLKPLYLQTPPVSCNKTLSK